MKIGIIGNMNNNANNLAQYLVDRGYEVEVLFYSTESDHFTPDSDNISAAPYSTKFLEWGSYAGIFRRKYRNIIRADLSGVDFLIGSRLAPAYFYRHNLPPLDIFMPTGGDIWTVPVFTDFQPKNLAKYLVFSKMQAEGIRRSAGLWMIKTNAETEAKIQHLIRGIPRFDHQIPMIYCPEYEGRALERRMAASQMRGKFEEIRRQSDIFLVHHVKHLWKPDSVRRFDHLQEKGNDRVLHGLARFLRERPKLSVRLLMTEYGVDVDASKALIQSLGIGHAIEWIPLSPRKELMMAIQLADAVIGEVARSWLTYGTIVEGIAMNKPIIHNRDDAYFAGRELYPMLHAHDADGIYNALQFMADRPDEAKAMGAAGGKWLREVAFGRAIDDICRLVDEKARRLAEQHG